MKEIKNTADKKATAKGEQNKSLEKAVNNKAENKFKKDGHYLYIGDSITNVIRHGTVYIGGIPMQFEEKIKEVPEIAFLFVDVNEASSKLKAVKEPGTRENVANAKIKEVKAW